jgi:hypothetical protein
LNANVRFSAVFHAALSVGIGDLVQTLPADMNMKGSLRGALDSPVLDGCSKLAAFVPS